MNKLVIVCGLPGVGKSTLAEALSKQLHFPVFSVDPIESAMLSAGMVRVRSYETGVAAYKVVEKLADEHLKLEYSVIVDAVSGVSKTKQMWRDLAQKHNAQLKIIECVQSDESLHRKRVEARTRSLPGLSELTWDDVKDCEAQYTKWAEAHLTLDSSNRVDANVAEAQKYLGV